MVVVLLLFDCMCVCLRVCRLTGQGLTYMTVDDIVTMPGYPHQYAPWHCRSLLMFYYRRNCQLCRAVRSFNPQHQRRRRRRQADDDDDDEKLVVTSDIVHDMLNEQA